jgi:predicted esterase YcpF (UPF0227 family)
MQYLYLHGFASSPRSQKAQDLVRRFAQAGRSLLVPDLNQNDFTHLTLTRQLQQVEPLLSQPTIVIGSSLGGLTAAWLGERNLLIDRLILLAPAFDFLAHWLPKLGMAQVQQWQQEGFLQVYHHGENQPLPLSYRFVEDAGKYQEAALQRLVPTVILHGVDDEVIPIAASQNFARTRPWVNLIELDSNHALANVSDEIWQAVQSFGGFPPQS